MDAYSLGRFLRETRENLEWTLDDAVTALKIRRRILESFEQGDFTVEGASDVQVRGFIRNYARYLKLDEDLILQYYDSARLNQRTSKRRSRRKRSTQEAAPVAPRKLTDTQPTMPRVTLGEQQDARRERVSGFLRTLLIVVVAAASIGVIGFVLLQLLEDPTSIIGEDPASDILADLPGTATMTTVPTFTPRPVVTDLPVLQQNYNGVGVVVTLEMQQRGWVRVAVSGEEQYAGIAEPDQLIGEFSAPDNITVESTNARALNIIYNGQQQGTFGGRGQAVTIVFTENDKDITTGPGPQPLQSLLTPSPTPMQRENLAATAIVARTPSATPTPTATPTVTSTPQFPTDSPTTQADAASAQATATQLPLIGGPGAPTLTPMPTNTTVPTVIVQSPTAVQTSTPLATATTTTTSTLTLTPTLTLTLTPTASPTSAFTPTPTAILPPRVTPPGITATPTKPVLP